MSITLAPLPRDAGARVAHLEVLPEQLAHVAEIGQMLGEPTPEVDFHAIFADAEAVGFFKIDRPEVVSWPFARRGEIGLRGFLIGAQYQGHGHGRAAVAALPAYLAAHYPAAPSAVLAVDDDNPVARRLYGSGGWAETGEGMKTRAGDAVAMRLDLGAHRG